MARVGEAKLRPVLDVFEYFVTLEVLLPTGQGASHVFVSVYDQHYTSSPFFQTGAIYEVLIKDGEYHRFDDGTVHVPSTGVDVLSRVADAGAISEKHCRGRSVRRIWIRQSAAR